MYIFLILYIFLIIPLLNNKFDKKIIFVSSLIFILSITFLREMQRATPTDFHNYFNAIEGTDTFLRFKSPTFGFFIDIFKDVFGLSSIVTYQLICLIPIICIFLSAFILRSYLLIPLFISSETFVLSSFNATRQGLAIGFLSLSLAFFIKEIIESKKVKIISYIKVIGFATVSFLSHESAIVVFSIVILSTVFKRFIKILISLRIEKKKLLFLILGLLLTSFFAFLQYNRKK